MDIQKPEDNIYFKPGDFWSLSQPVPVPPSNPDQDQDDEKLPLIEFASIPSKNRQNV